MKEEWLRLCRSLSAQPTPLPYRHGRDKVIEDVEFSFTPLKPDISLAELGFTARKMSQLHRDYFNATSRGHALHAWEKVVQQGVGSVSFDTIPALSSGQAKKEKPCILGMRVDLVNNDGQQHIEIHVHFDRSDVFRRLPADMLFLVDITQPFERAPIKIKRFYCHIDKAHCSAKYMAFPALVSGHPVQFIADIQDKDAKFWQKSVTSTPQVLHQHSKWESLNRVSKFLNKRLHETGKHQAVCDYLKTAASLGRRPCSGSY